jgi:hypothetical protein
MLLSTREMDLGKQTPQLLVDIHQLQMALGEDEVVLHEDRHGEDPQLRQALVREI